MAAAALCCAKGMAMTDTFRQETRIEDHLCMTLLLGAFLWLFLLTVDLSKTDPPFVHAPPPCEYNCR